MIAQRIAPFLVPILALGRALAAGPPAVDFALPSLAGGKVGLSDLRGKVVLLFFISDECGVCHEELPHVNAIYHAFKAKGFVVIGLLPREPAPASSLREAAFPLVLSDEKVRNAYRIPGYPVHYLLDREHRLAVKHRGFSSGRERLLETEVRQLLGGEDLNEQGMDLYQARGSWEGHFLPGKGYRMPTGDLMRWLKEADSAKRLYAIEELGRRKATDAIAMLGSIVVDRREPPAERRKALAALVRIGSAAALGSFLAVARARDEPPLLRSEAVAALGPHSGAAGVAGLLATLLSDPEGNVRLAAGAVIGERCVTAAKAPLDQALARERNDWIRRSLQTSLAKLTACAPAAEVQPRSAAADAP